MRFPQHFSLSHSLYVSFSLSISLSLSLSLSPLHSLSFSLFFSCIELSYTTPKLSLYIFYSLKSSLQEFNLILIQRVFLSVSFSYLPLFLTLSTKDILEQIKIQRGILFIMLSVFQVPLLFYAVKFPPIRKKGWNFSQLLNPFSCSSVEFLFNQLFNKNPKFYIVLRT